MEHRLKERKQPKVQNWRCVPGERQSTVPVAWSARYDEQTRHGKVDALDSQEQGVDRQR